MLVKLWCRCSAARRFRMYTRRRFEDISTGGRRRGSSPVLLTKNGPRKVITCSRSSPKVTTWCYPFYVWEEVESNMFQIPPIIRFTWWCCSTPVILRETWGTSCQMVRFCLSPRFPCITNDLHVSIATPPGFLLTLRFSSSVHHLLGPDKTKKTRTTHLHTHVHTYTHIHYTHIYTHIHTFAHTYMYIYIYKCLHVIIVMCLCCVCCLYLSAVVSASNTCTCTVTLYVIEEHTNNSNCFFFFFSKNFHDERNSNSNLPNSS